MITRLGSETHTRSQPLLHRERMRYPRFIYLSDSMRREGVFHVMLFLVWQQLQLLMQCGAGESRVRRCSRRWRW